MPTCVAKNCNSDHPKLKLNAVPTIFDHNKKKKVIRNPKDRSATSSNPNWKMSY